MLLASGVLLALRDVPMSQVQVDYVDGHLTTMGVITFLVMLALIALAWAYLLGGIAHTRAAVRVPGLVLLTLAIGWRLRDASFTPAGTAAVVAAFAVVWLTVLAGGGMYRRRRRDASGTSSLWFALVPLLLVEMALIYATVWWGLADRYRFPFVVTDQLSTFAEFLVPVLVLAGVDLAELADLVAGGVAATITRLRSGYLIIAASAVVAAAAGASVVHGGLDVGAQAIPAAVLATLVCAVIWLRRRVPIPHGHVPLVATALVAIAIAFFVTAPVVAASLFPPSLPAGSAQGPGVPTSVTFGNNTTVPLVPYRHDAAPRFGISYPEIWQVATDLDEGPGKRTVIEFNGNNVQDNASYLVASVPVAGHPDESAAFASLFDTHVCLGGCTPTRSRARVESNATVSDLSVAFAAGGIGVGRVRSSTRGGRYWWQ
ncbi:MAG: hypothetical protein ACYDAG_03910, partial [Chloroflexota bacterium]